MPGWQWMLFTRARSGDAAVAPLSALREWKLFSAAGPGSGAIVDTGRSGSRSRLSWGLRDPCSSTSSRSSPPVDAGLTANPGHGNGLIDGCGEKDGTRLSRGHELNANDLWSAERETGWRWGFPEIFNTRP